MKLSEILKESGGDAKNGVELLLAAQSSKPKRNSTMKKLMKKIEKQIKDIENDSRYQQKPALIQVNAPLALIQTDLHARLSTLKWMQEEMKATKA